MRSALLGTPCPLTLSRGALLLAALCADQSYVYPASDDELNKMSRAYRIVYTTILKESPYVTSDPLEATLFIPNVDVM